ncbi:MAG: DUF4202 domain-containing protein [Hyphomicrobiales bacterium]
MTSQRFKDTLAAIDAANSKDPRQVDVDGTKLPVELIYGQRMSEVLDEIAPDASEHLKIAVRAQHIERWTSPRQDYPEGKASYLKWRSDLKDFHANRAGALMEQAGYEEEDIARVKTIVAKKGIKRDAEVQLLEDAACIVFLKYYAAEFIAPHDDEKVISILAKSARKMSQDGISAASKLQLDERVGRLLGAALNS